MLLSKVEAIATDYEASEIISQEDRDKLENEVNIVFNVLATIKFNEKLYDAVTVNMTNTRKVLQLGIGMKNLKSFVHVSTMFTNSNQVEQDERIYDHPLTYQELSSISEAMRKIDDAKALKLDFKHDFRNTYVLTKHFAEKLVIAEGSDLPLGIFRPPIVISSYKKLPGWTDNLSKSHKNKLHLIHELNSTATLQAYGPMFTRGISHCWLGNENLSAKIAPVDYVINGLVASAWDISVKFEKAKQNQLTQSTPIYNYIFEECSITFKKMLELIPQGFHAPLENSVYYYSVIKTSNVTLFNILYFFLTTIPAFLLDCFARIQNKKVINMKIAQQCKYFLDLTAFFVTGDFNFKFNRNIAELSKKVRAMKNYRDELNFDMNDIDWSEFFKNFLPGLKQYFFKEDMSKCESLTKSYRRWIENILKYFHDKNILSNSNV